MIKKCVLLLSVAVLASCSDSNIYTKKESPSNAFKDYEGHDKSIVGIGKTISERKALANLTISYKGKYTLEEALVRFGDRYDLAIEWDGNIDKNVYKKLTASKQSFNDARSYLEDVFDLSIVRIRDRAIKVMLPSTVEKLELFNPGPNVRLAEAVHGLADLCDINLVVADYKDVLAQEKITTNLKDITCQQAFQAILSPFGLSLKSKGSYYTISGLPYKEWSLNLHEQKRDEGQKINYSSEFSGGSGGGDGSESNYISGGSSFTNISYTRNLWESLETDLKELVEQACKNSQSMGYEPAESRVSVQAEDGMLQMAPQEMAAPVKRERPCGYVRVNPDVGLVQMQAPKRVIEKADDIISRLEDIASRRLLVEARVLAVTKERSYDRGSDLSIRGSIDGTKFGVGFNPTQSLKDAGSVTSMLNDLLRVDQTRLPGGALGVGAGDLDAVVRFVQSFGTTYQLMKPTVEVMDRQKATLIDGRNERYFIRTATVDNSGETPVVTTDAEERVQFVGIQFSASAQIADNEDGLHTLSLQIPMTEITDYVVLENQAGSDEDGNPIMMTDRIPIATTRVIDQKVRIRDGEVKVIGGLTRTIAVDKETGVPLIQEVPVAGKLFSEESIAYEEAEFIVLLQVRKLD